MIELIFVNSGNIMTSAIGNVEFFPDDNFNLVIANHKDSSKLVL